MSTKYRWTDYSFNGYLGLIWSLKILTNLNIINAPVGLSSMFNSGINLYSRYYQEMPIQYNPNDYIYPSGFIAMLFCDKEDTIESYFRRENTIHLIRDCEKILTKEIPFLHSPYDLSISQLHSILFFCWRLTDLICSHIKPKNLLFSLKLAITLQQMKSLEKKVYT